MKRIIALGDMHCGNFGGLAPSAWRAPKEEYPISYALEEEMWSEYGRLVAKYKRRRKDTELIVVCNGDAIDGAKNVGELLTADRDEQCDMAMKCLGLWEADQYIFTYGTPLHTGKEEAWEKVLAKRMNGDIASVQYLDAEGVVFMFRHKVSRSAIPYGRHTAVARIQVWNQINQLRGKEPHVNVFCLSHVHYHIGGFGRGWMGMTLPALQTTSCFGARECDGEVDWGIAHFDVADGQIVDWGADVIELENNKARVTVL